MKGWGLPVRRSASALAAALVAVAGLAVSPTPAGAATCTDAQLVPKLHEFAVLQGLPSYARLAREKDFLAKLFLSLPTCATGTGAEIQLQDGSVLTVNGTSHTAMSPPAAGPFPSLAPESAAPAPDTTGDPRWLVPGSALVGSPTSPLGTTITATVRYRARPSSTAAFSDVRTVAFSTSVQVDRPTKPLRVLFVTMGDAGKTGQFSTSATKALGQGVDALGRLFPVASGVAVLGTPAAANAGVAHAVDAGMLNLGSGPGGLALMPNGRFCGTGGNFDTVASRLGGFLSGWNQANPNATADRVIGVVDQAVSSGVASGCAEGMAQMDGTVGWVRVVYDRNGNSTFTGALLGMELGHTLGLSAPTVSDGFGHSRNVEADVTSPNRAYDVRLARYVPDDHTLMRFSATWNDGNVLLERDDWAWAQCRLGGLSTSCLGAGPIGGVVAAGPRFVLDAVAHRGPGGALTVDVVDAELRDGSSDDTTAPNPGSDVRLRFEDGDGATLAEEGVTVEFDETHGDDHGDHTGTIHVVRPFDGATRRWKLLQGDRVLAEREVGTAPEITGTDAQPDTDADEVTSVEAWTDTADDEARPALAAGLVAWATPAGAFVAPVDDPATATADDGWARRVAVAGTEGATAPTLAHDGSRLAYETAGGNVAVATVTHDPASGDVTVGPSQVVYNAALTVLQRPAHHPTLTADDNLVIEVGGDLYLIALEPNPLDPLRCALSPVLPCRQLTTGGGASGPSASPASADVAYAKGGDVRVVDNVTLLDRLLVAGGREPAWSGQPGAERLAFTRDAPAGPDLWLTNPRATVPGDVAQRLTRLGADSHPGLAWSPAGGVVAVERQYANPDHRELVLVRVAPNDDPSSTRTVYTTTAASDRPDDLRARFYRRCRDGRLHPFGWGVPPVDVDGREAHFAVVFDAGANPADACADGVTRHEVSDGTQRDHEDVGAPSTQDRAPVVWVAGALEGATYREGQAVVVACAGRDPDGGALPPATLTASVTGPQAATGGATLTLVPKPGTYVATCTGTSEGIGASASATFRVLGPQVLVVADFDPDVLQVPPDPSESKTVTFLVQPPAGRALRDVAGSTVRLSTIGGRNVSGDDRFRVLDWAVVRTPGGGHQGVAKIDRLTLARFLEEHGMVERHVSIGIVGEAPDWGFAGEDEPLIRSR